MDKIVCFLPVHNGIQFNEITWGMYKTAKKIASHHHVPLIAIVVHAGLHEDEIVALPFDHIYHIQLEKSAWYLADEQIKAYEAVRQVLNLTSGIYLFSSEPIYQEIAVRLSVRIDSGIITNVLELLPGEQSGSEFIVKRSIYNDKAHEWLSFEKEMSHKYITFDKAALFGEQEIGRAGKIEEIRLPHHKSGSIIFLRESLLSFAEMKINEARCVIGIGRGVYGHETSALEPVYKLAELLNAPIGGSKVADEFGLISREKRIGSSGHSIDADVYIAIGISGSTQHLAGISRVKHVIAINHDAAAPIFSRCDIGIIGDFRESVRLLVDILER